MKNVLAPACPPASILAVMLLATTFSLRTMAWGAAAESEPIDIGDWTGAFAFHYDYVVAETAGLPRDFAPIEVTLSVPGGLPQRWYDHIRVVRLESDRRGRLVPHQVLGDVSAILRAEAGQAAGPAPARSVNVVFLGRCPAGGEVTYRLFWGPPSGATAAGRDLPSANMAAALQVGGEAPALTIGNEFYHIELDPKSGAIRTARRACRDEGEATVLRYKQIPIHFGTDVWSPPQGWDHDYDWPAPPNQKCERGPLLMRYHRWGPLQNYRDVHSSISYTFYAHVPYVHVSAILEFTADRSVRAVRMGEIVVAHSRTGDPGDNDTDAEGDNLFSHYAWPTKDGRVFRREIDAHRSADGMANVQGIAPGALGILDRDVPWVAGYEATKGYGMATLRGSQYVGNRLGGPIPQSAPCTYVANYGWAFTYWSRPMVYPLGMKQTAEDQNMAVAAGTIFATEEALLVFQPDEGLSQVQRHYRQFVTPLRLEFKGTGPW